MVRLPKLYFSKQVSEIDKNTLVERQISIEELVDEAVEALWKSVQGLLSKEKSYLFLLGKGNNAADAKGLAQKLDQHGYKTKKLHVFEEEETPLNLNKDTVVVDGVFGAAFHGELPEKIQKLFKRINESDVDVWAVDVASGLDANLGIATPNTLMATKTFNMGVRKLCSQLPYLRDFTGELHFVPVSLSVNIEAAAKLVSEEWVRSLKLANSDAQSHKYTNGRLYLEAGSEKYPGAAQLCARAAFRAGCGYLGLASSAFEQCLASYPELVQANTESAARDNWDACVIGPGLNLEVTPEYWKDLLRSGKRIVWDASALPFLKKLLESEKPELFKNSLITPHEGEFSKLFECEKFTNFEERYQALKEASSKHPELCILLKGSGTLIAQGGEIDLVSTGNESLASAGHGDTLAGIIGALMARGLSPRDSARAAAYIQGQIADDYAQNGAAQGLLAHELADKWPEAVKLLQ